MFGFSNHGSRAKPVREAILDDGKLRVVTVGFEDFQDFIQSFADSTNIEMLVARAVNGEPELLNARSGMYGDFTDLPNDLAEMERVMNSAVSFYDSLPDDKKAEFGSFNDFISSMDDKDFLVKAGFVTPSDDESEVSE